MKLYAHDKLPEWGQIRLARLDAYARLNHYQTALLRVTLPRGAKIYYVFGRRVLLIKGGYG